ncbi:MAG: hypothetical protein HAW66_03640 [Shewanella sp.]|nr:hypothetical protein [Shewanella sp.]
MAGMLRRVIITCTLVLGTLFLAGCGDERPDKIAHYQQLTKSRIESLAVMLNNGQLRNAELLKQYSQVLGETRTELTPLLNQLSKDATPEGTMFLSLQKRLKDASVASNFIDLDQQLAEIENLYQATDPSLFNDMLSDPVNVIADMSNGSLARINAISREAELLANGAESFGAGSQLVGNPGYGNWQTNSSGTSFWAWYGMYSMFSNVFRSPISYDNWSNRRGYSYYGDKGRYRYTSPKQRSGQEKVYQNTKKRFSRQGKTFNSPYAKTRTGATSLSRASQSAPKSSASPRSKFRSNYAKNSGFRNSSSRTSRSVSRGK